MIRWLKAVIARLLGTRTKHTDRPVLRTQTVGPVLLGRTHQAGNKRSALTTAPVQTEQKPKRSRARKTTAEASSKQERTSAKRTAIQVGSPQATPAFPIQQPAPTPTKRGRKRAEPTK